MATTSNALIHALKLLLMSTGLLFLAILLTPQIFSFSAAQLPTISTSLRSWLRPPYLYFIINGIIITIAATSRIHHHYKHPHPAADDQFHHHNVHFRSALDDAYTSDKPTAPLLSLPSEPSPFPIPVHDPVASFHFSFAAAHLDKINTSEETTKLGATETGSDAIQVFQVEEKVIAEEDQAPGNSKNYELASVESELVALTSVRKTRSPPPESAPLARQETFEVVSCFFQSQMEKPLPSARFTQNRKQPTLTSLDETATFSRVVTKEILEKKTPSPSPSPSPPPLARQETSEIVSSFFQSQIEKKSPTARFVLNHNQKPLVSLDEIKEERNHSNTPQSTEFHPPPPPSAPLARQETSEIVSSFFQSQIEKPPASTRFGHHRKPTRSTPEGGKGLRVGKAKKSETLESTWRSITEGRHMPLTRHLKKSETCENKGRQPVKVKKADTFTDQTSHSALASAATAKILRKEPSLSQEELNRRVEAFINKVNQDMRLQRQQSIQKFKETVTR